MFSGWRTGELQQRLRLLRYIIKVIDHGLRESTAEIDVTDWNRTRARAAGAISWTVSELQRRGAERTA